jgi:hypothetical protein
MADLKADRITPVFKTHTLHNEAKSKKEGRPIFDEMEVVEVHIPGNRDTIGVYPATAQSHFEETADGSRYAVTYAERWPEQYRRFKEGKEQISEGTPLSELPFLTDSKRAELRALKVYTAEQLAGLDGANLKLLGMFGRSLKDQAQAYIDASAGTANVTALAADNAAQRLQIEQLQADIKALQSGEKPIAHQSTRPKTAFDDTPDDELKAYIKDKTGQPLKGNHSHETLVRMANEASGGDDDA